MSCLLYTSECARGINAFRGAGRRFEFLGEVNGVTIADDYAHHPTELEATLRAAKAVSYTHLDVYKRQNGYSASAEKEI